MFILCHRWLQVIAAAFVLLGLVLAIFPHSSLVHFVFNQFIDLVFWTEGAPPADALEFQGWIYGLLGATISGWGVLILFVLAYPFKERRRWAWNALAASFGLWYIVDTGASAWYGVMFNVIFNTVVLVALALPLLLSRKYFKS